MNKKQRGSLAIEGAIVVTITLLVLFTAMGFTYSIYIHAKIMSEMRGIASELSIALSADAIEPIAEVENHIPLPLKALTIGEVINLKLSDRFKDYQIISDIDSFGSTFDNFDIFNWRVVYKVHLPLMTFERHVLYPVRHLLGGSELNTDAACVTDQESITVYETRTGECYHLETCFYLRKSKIPISLEDADAKGLRACKVCRPINLTQ